MTAKVQHTRSRIAMTLVLLSGCGLSLNALAASDKVIDCDSLARNIESFDVPVRQLSISVVDHIPLPATELAGTLDIERADAQNLAPVLLLTPRVASMLDRVFDTDNAEPGSSDLNDATSPVADRLSRQDDPSDDLVLVQEADADKDLNLPNLQHRMFRNDI